MKKEKEILVIAGEASGDLHGSNLMAAMKAFSPYPLKFTGIGGEKMGRQGLDSLFDIALLSVVGLTEVITELRHIIRAYNIIKGRLRQKRPDLVILIDYPGFNLRVARIAHGLGIPVMYYICPQVWAWRRGRSRLLARYCNSCAVILPFEEAFLRERGVNARFVGHPLLSIVKARRSRRTFLKDLNLDENAKTIGLLPGSRRGEIKRHLPIMIETARLLKERLKDVQFLMPLSPGTDPRWFHPYPGDLLMGLGIRLIKGKNYDAMAACDCLLLASGTVTLEASILEVPHVVIYKVSQLTYLLGRCVVRVPFIALSNLVAGKEVAREFIQGAARPAILSETISGLVVDREIQARIKAELRGIKEALGGPGAPERAAQMALELL